MAGLRRRSDEWITYRKRISCRVHFSSLRVFNGRMSCLNKIRGKNEVEKSTAERKSVNGPVILISLRDSARESGCLRPAGTLIRAELQR